MSGRMRRVAIVDVFLITRRAPHARGAMDRDRREHAEHGGIARYLQAELEERLDRNRDEADDRADTRPVGRTLVRGLAETPADRVDENRERRHDGDTEQNAAFREELKVIVVSLFEMDRPVAGLVLRHRHAERIHSGTDEGEITADRERVLPGLQPSASTRSVRTESADSENQRVHSGPPGSGNEKKYRQKQDPASRTACLLPPLDQSGCQ